MTQYPIMRQDTAVPITHSYDGNLQHNNSNLCHNETSSELIVINCR